MSAVLPDVTLIDVTGMPADLASVDALARRALTARRHGQRLVLAGAGPELLALVRLLGLSDVLVEAGREPEQREQPLGVEEVVDPGDPAV